MKYIYMSFFIFVFIFNVNAEDKTKEKQIIIVEEPSDEEIRKLQEENSKLKKITSEVIKFIDENYAQEAKKLIPKLEKRVNSLKDKLSISTNKKFKEKLANAIKEAETELKIQKMWVLYHKYYVLAVVSKEKAAVSRAKKDKDEYKIAAKALDQIRKTYQKLKAESFPAPEDEYFRKNFKKVQKFLGRNKDN